MNIALDKRYDSWFEDLVEGGAAVAKARKRITELAGDEMGAKSSR